MTIDSAIKSIADLGLTIVLSGIVVYVLIKAINIFFAKWNFNKEHKYHDKAINLRNEIGMKIQDVIKGFLMDHEGARLEVIEFSNSVQSVAFLPFRYMTCTYEVFEYGRDPIGHKIDRVSTSLFTNFFTYLQSHPYHLFNINDTDDEISGRIASLFEGTGDIQQVVSVLMKTPYDKAIGFICFKKVNPSSSDIEDCVKLSEQISGMLSINDIKHR